MTDKQEPSLVQPIILRTASIRLDAALKLAAAVPSGGAAKYLIQSGQVSVCGVPCLQRGRQLTVGDTIQLSDPDGARLIYEVVGK